MILYRAMCINEYNSNMKFIKRFKWASLNIDFILNRVQDGKFNNSFYKKGAYDIIVSFEINDNSKYKILNKNEIMFDRRDNIYFKNIKKLQIKL